MRIDSVALAVFVFFFAIVTVVGFYAARFRAGDLTQLQEWGLAGRRFGTVVSWFLIGGDLYTAYTLIAVPAAVYGTGALGFFAVPYTIVAYPFMFAVMPRLWNVSKRHNFVTPADFVHARYGCSVLATLVAITGLLATMPYIALQLVGIQVVIGAMGVSGSGWAGDLPLILAFAILAAYTYTSGLRAPAMIAFVKDAMIYIVTIAAVIAVAGKFGGFGPVFAAAHAHFTAAAAAIPKPAAVGSVVLGPKGYWAYATLAFGSAFALFLYPHAITGLLSSKSGEVIKRNAILLPAYSLLLGLVALLGFAAIALGVVGKSPQFAVPGLIIALFPPWFVGFAFAAIAIGALVPAAVMSIAAGNLWTRNIYRVYVRPGATPAQESRQAKLASLVVKLGALVFIIFVPTQYAIDLQLLGGIWMLQTFPAIVTGLFRRIFHHVALIVGWFVAMVAGTLMSFSQGVKPTFPLSLGGVTINAYIGLEVLVLNLVVTAILTVAFDRMKLARYADRTTPSDYRSSHERSPGVA